MSPFAGALKRSSENDDLVMRVQRQLALGRERSVATDRLSGSRRLASGV